MQKNDDAAKLKSLAEKMEQISTKIFSWADYAADIPPDEDNVLIVSFDNGDLKMYPLFCAIDNSVNVTHAFMPKGLNLPTHTHAEHEYIIVYKGHLVFYHLDKPNVDVTENKHIYYSPNSPHGVKALEDTWMIGITIPGSEGYPK